MADVLTHLEGGPDLSDESPKKTKKLSETPIMTEIIKVPTKASSSSSSAPKPDAMDVDSKAEEGEGKEADTTTTFAIPVARPRRTIKSYGGSVPLRFH